jgi:hypothetical protein
LSLIKPVAAAVSKEREMTATVTAARTGPVVLFTRDVDGDGSTVTRHPSWSPM